jgi:hypothetical protein
MMKRYKNIIGKRIGGFLYFHKEYMDEVDPIIVKIVKKYQKRLGLDFNIVKYSPVAISFINSPDFDTADEPVVLESWRYNVVIDKWTKYTFYGNKPNRPIYHNKWLFVKDDYTGFDVELAKRRSNFLDVYMYINKINKSKIGYQKYWKSLNI